MSKQKFDPNATAKKFLSSIEPEQSNKDDNQTESKLEYLPEVKKIGTNRPTSVDKKTGEVTKQIGYLVTASQDKRLTLLGLEYGTNKSAILREAIRMYFDYIDKNGEK